MADFVVIYDPQLELATIVNTDEMRAIGPIAAGPNAQRELSQFVATMPEQVMEMGSHDLCLAWVQFWQTNFAALYDPATASDSSPVVAGAATGDDGAALAEHEASAGRGEPPPPAPADADLDADTGEADTVTPNDTTNVAAGAVVPTTAPEVVPCFACSGTGRVPGATTGEVTVCNMCEGSGRITQPVAQS